MMCPANCINGATNLLVTRSHKTIMTCFDSCCLFKGLLSVTAPASWIVFFLGFRHWVINPQLVCVVSLFLLAKCGNYHLWLIGFLSPRGLWMCLLRADPHMHKKLLLLLSDSLQWEYERRLTGEAVLIRQDCPSGFKEVFECINAC